MERKASRSEPLVKQILAATFPEYKGRKIRITTKVPCDIKSYWTEGTGSFFKFYQPSTGIVMDVLSNHPFFEPDRPRFLKNLPPSVVLVERKYFCGHDLGIVIYVKEPEQTRLEETKLLVFE